MLKLLSTKSARPKPLSTKPNIPKSDQAVPQSVIANSYKSPRSFTDFLPWVEYIEESQCFLLEDGQSVGALVDITPIGTEARETDFMEELRDSIQSVLTDSIPEDEEAPWIVQFFVQDDHDFGLLESRLVEYGSEEAKQTQYNEFYNQKCREHLRRISRPGGLFHDSAVTGTRWRGQTRKIRAIIYRRQPSKNKNSTSLDECEKQLNETVARFSAGLEMAGLTCTRGTDRDLSRWLMAWFNPKPAIDSVETSQDLVELVSNQEKAEPVYGHDFAESLVLNCPISDAENGVWWFDGIPHTFVTIQNFRHIPSIGVLTAEQTHGTNTYALFDRLPEQTILSMTITVKSQATIRNHVARIKRAAVGDTADAVLTREDAEAVEKQVARGNKLYPVSVGFYVRGNDLAQLRDNVMKLHALLLPNGFQPIGNESDLIPLDSYLRNLPMAYDEQLDKIRRRSRFVFSKHAANLLPIYGRSRGTGNPGIVFFNRGAELLDFDPLHPQDRKKNAHTLILGPTGAGKSAMLVYLLQQMVARHRPRVFIIEAGGSFALLGEHFKSLGLSVNQITLQPDSDVSLPPFADAIDLVREEKPDAAAAESSENFARDRLGEMEIVARVMITGGDIKENEKVSRSDRLLIRNSILTAARTAYEQGKDQVLIDDVVDALLIPANDKSSTESRRVRTQEMADSMALFTSGVAGYFFNRTGSPWPDVDVTILEMGLLAREGYEDQLTVAYLSMMSHINDLIEKHQHSNRQTLVVTDEGHLITTHPLLANYVVKITKMWRKLGAWFWIATQNLGDFPDASKRMLNMLEWWLCLVMPKEEIDQIARFRELTEAQRLMLLSAKKEPGKYVEGVVLSDKIEALFRNVPPALSLALAMTEKHEKAERYRIMQELNCSEAEAAVEVAKKLVQCDAS